MERGANDNFPTERTRAAGCQRSRGRGGSLKQKLRCNNILTILARKMWPGIQKRKVESLTMLNECSLCVCECDRKGQMERESERERRKDATLTLSHFLCHAHTHTHTCKAKAVSFAFAAAKEISSANCSNILALPRTQAHPVPPPSSPHSPLSTTFHFAAGQNNGWDGWWGRGVNIVQMQRVVT